MIASYSLSLDDPRLEGKLLEITYFLHIFLDRLMLEEVTEDMTKQSEAKMEKYMKEHDLEQIEMDDKANEANDLQEAMEQKKLSKKQKKHLKEKKNKDLKERMTR